MAPRRNRAVEEDSQATMVDSLAPVRPPSPPSVVPPATPIAAAPGAEREPEKDGAAEDETLTDLEYMARRMKRSLEDAEADDNDDEAAWEQDDDEKPAEVSPKSCPFASATAHMSFAACARGYSGGEARW